MLLSCMGLKSTERFLKEKLDKNGSQGNADAHAKKIKKLGRMENCVYIWEI